jgi:hypothetical protein
MHNYILKKHVHKCTEHGHAHRHADIHLLVQVYGVHMYNTYINVFKYISIYCKYTVCLLFVSVK